MKIALLCRSPQLYSHKRIIAAARARGHEIDTINHLRCTIDIAAHRPNLYYQKRALDGYDAAVARMLELAATMPGYLGIESARDGLGITVSYWRDLESIAAWKRHAEHAEVQGKGRARWYSAYRTRICRVERDYGFERSG